MRQASLVAVVFIVLSVASAQAAEEAIRIALIDPLSGPTALQGESSHRYIQMAVDEINSGGVLGGRRIEIMPLDNKGNPQEALIALKHATDHGIRFVMQGVGAHIAHALSEAIAKHNEREPGRTVLYLNYSAPDPALTNEKCNFWHFRFDSHSDMKLDALTTALAGDRNIQRVYLINQDYSYGRRVARMSREMLARKRPDIRIVVDELHPLAKIKDFAPYAAKIKASRADAILTGNWGNDLSLLIKAGYEAGLKATYFTMWANILGMGQTIATAGAGKVRNVANWYVNGPDNRLERFYLEYKRKHGEDWLFTPSRTALAMLVHAILVSNSTDPLKLARALEDMRFDAGPARSGCAPTITRSSSRCSLRRWPASAPRALSTTSRARDLAGKSMLESKRRKLPCPRRAGCNGQGSHSDSHAEVCDLSRREMGAGSTPGARSVARCSDDVLHG